MLKCILSLGSFTHNLLALWRASHHQLFLRVPLAADAAAAGTAATTATAAALRRRLRRLVDLQQQRRVLQLHEVVYVLKPRLHDRKPRLRGAAAAAASAVERRSTQAPQCTRAQSQVHIFACPHTAAALAHARRRGHVRASCTCGAHTATPTARENSNARAPHAHTFIALYRNVICCRTSSSGARTNEQERRSTNLYSKFCGTGGRGWPCA